jgi:site-specific recombinase XerD
MKENYINYIKYTRRLADDTVIFYEKWLKYLERYLVSISKSVDDPENIKLVDIYNFIEDLSKEWLSSKTIAGIINSTRAYMKYCKEIVELEVIDYHKIKAPKVREREIWFFSKEEKRIILALVNRGVWKKEETQLRNKLLTYLFLYTWLRISELSKIKVCDIWESIQVIGKGGKRRFVYLKPEILDLIYLYLGKRKKQSDYLFAWTKGHLGRIHIVHIFNKMSKECWVHIHAHKFRHTFATDLLHVPWSNIYSVAKLLGHSRITTTQIYLWADNSELKQLQFWLKYC